MRKLVIAVGLALLMAAPSWAASLGVGIAYWDTSDASQDEGFGLKVAFDMGESVDFEVRASFFDNFAQVANNALIRLEVTPVDLGFAYHFKSGGKANAYVGGGGTFVATHAIFDGGQVPRAGGPEVKDEFGFYGVVGIEAAVNERFGVFGEVLYRTTTLQVTGNDFGFADFGADLDGPAGTLGVMLRW